MKEFAFIFISAILINNIVLSKFMGICSFLGVSQQIKSSLGMGAAVTFVMALTGLITYPVYYYILVPMQMEYMRTISFILIIAALVQIVESLIKKLFPPLYRSLGIYLALITTNCAVLGVALINLNEEYNFAQSMVNSIATGLAYTLALLLFAGIRIRTEHSEVPAAFRGVPSTLISASILALSFVGFSGLAG